MIMTRPFIQDERGAGALEFALLVPAYLTVVIGLISLCIGLFSLGSLQFAVERGARCASVQTTTCTSDAAVETYIASYYYGLPITPTYTHQTLACGHDVSASFTYVMNMVMFQISMPFTLSACFP